LPIITTTTTTTTTYTHLILATLSFYFWPMPKKICRMPNFMRPGLQTSFFNKNIQGIEASVALLLGNFFLINMLGTNKGHNDRLLQPTCRFSLAAIFILEKKKKKGELELQKKSRTI
jgi:hypothetical protein